MVLRGRAVQLDDQDDGTSSGMQSGKVLHLGLDPSYQLSERQPAASTS